MAKLESPTYWDKQTILSRIADIKARIRYEAGSPNQTEVDLYRKCILNVLNFNDAGNKRVLVLGMTPELRSMALCCGFKVISIDHSQVAIDMYKDWMPIEHKANEKIIHGSWQDVGKYIREPVDAVMGDGVFGNILSVEQHIELLSILKTILTHDGTMVFRKVLVPDDFNPDSYDSYLLIQNYRSGLLSDAEFGFSMRLWGNYKSTYDPQSYILDNSRTFQTYHTWVAEGKLSEPEYACICHYYFNGLNMILPQSKWEEILISLGLTFEWHQLKGKDWYSYYPIYQCRFKGP